MLNGSLPLKCTRAVVAHRAVVGCGDVVLAGRDVCDLTSLRRTGYDRVAIVTAHTGVIAVAEDGLKNISRLRRAAVGF